MAHSLEERAFVIQNYDSKNPNSAKVAKKFLEKFGYKISDVWVRNVWKSEGFPMGERGGRRYGLSDEEAKEAYIKYGGNPVKASKEIGYYPNSIKRRWKLLKLV